MDLSVVNDSNFTVWPMGKLSGKYLSPNNVPKGPKYVNKFIFILNSRYVKIKGFFPILKTFIKHATMLNTTS